MYSKEIDEVLRRNNYTIDVDTYFKICNSPQVDHIKYEYDQFHAYTNDGYNWIFHVSKTFH